MIAKLKYNPVLLVVLDGFGITEDHPSNAVFAARTRFFDSLVQNYPAMLLQASGEAVGLPIDEVGNSEVGHINIGSGIRRYQSLPRINQSIFKKEFFNLEPLKQAIQRVKKGANLHLIGLLGNGGVHASQFHLESLLTLANNAGIKGRVFIHGFLDGRDTPRDKGKSFVADLLKTCENQRVGELASLGGRFFGMDRNKNWDRIEKAYNAIVFAKSNSTTSDPLKKIKESYKKSVFDEEFEPTVILDKTGNPKAQIKDGDAVIFFNFRADRARQLTQALSVSNFDKFKTKDFKDLLMITFTEYEEGLPVKVLFPTELIKNPLAKIFSDAGLKQLHIAETEKYAHVTFFLNGMEEKSFAQEERILVPSPAVTSYDEKPQMSAPEVTGKVIEAINSDKFNFIALNYANPDMVGHTGNLKATITAVETVDNCLSQIVPLVIKKGGIVFIVGDHGNAEEMFNITTGQVDKEHNMYPVPFVIAANPFSGKPYQNIIGGSVSSITPSGILSDVAPTILKIVGLSAPSEMTGVCLVKT